MPSLHWRRSQVSSKSKPLAICLEKYQELPTSLLYIIPIEVNVTMAFTDVNKHAMDIYRDLVSEKYKELIHGQFEDATAAILQGIKAETESDTDTEQD